MSEQYDDADDDANFDAGETEIFWTLLRHGRFNACAWLWLDVALFGEFERSEFLRSLSSGLQSLIEGDVPESLAATIGAYVDQQDLLELRTNAGIVRRLILAECARMTIGMADDVDSDLKQLYPAAYERRKRELRDDGDLFSFLLCDDDGELLRSAIKRVQINELKRYP